MLILICNAGSTSLKFKLWDMPGDAVLAQGRVERIGLPDSIFAYAYGAHRRETVCAIPDYEDGVARFLDCLTDPAIGAVASLRDVDAMGFKTVLAKGFPGVHRIDEAVKAGMRAYLSVAPVHNRAYLSAIEVLEKRMPGTPLIGAFETAFHQTIPAERALYAIPYAWIERYGIRKLGFHGASHAYIAEATGRTGRVISCHLGGSSSICAIRDGVSLDNSFGFSLQAGLPHNNRVGDLDAFVIPFLLREGVSLEEIERGLVGEAGLKGISGTTGDMRDIERAMDAGDQRAILAFDMLADAVARTVGSYFVTLGGLDTLAFTGGIGEHCARLRAAVCGKLGCLGVTLDEAANESLPDSGVISKPGAPVRVRVIQTDEEYMVARAVLSALQSAPVRGITRVIP